MQINRQLQHKQFRIVCISDTHGNFPQEMPFGDILIHAGDISHYGKQISFDSFFKWIDKLDFKYKVIIAGNHDLVLYRENYYQILQQDSLNLSNLANIEVAQKIQEKYIFLENSSVNIEGLNIWGSSYTAVYGNNDELSKQIYSKIPQNTHVVVTHQPPHGYGDEMLQGAHTGDIELSKRIFQIKPLLHVFGHVHEGYGKFTENGITFINASFKSTTQPYNPPHLINIEI